MRRFTCQVCKREIVVVDGEDGQPYEAALDAAGGLDAGGHLPATGARVWVWGPVAIHDECRWKVATARPS